MKKKHFNSNYVLGFTKFILAAVLILAWISPIQNYTDTGLILFVFLGSVLLIHFMKSSVASYVLVIGISILFSVYKKYSLQYLTCFVPTVLFVLLYRYVKTDLRKISVKSDAKFFVYYITDILFSFAGIGFGINNLKTMQTVELAFYRQYVFILLMLVLAIYLILHAVQPQKSQSGEIVSSKKLLYAYASLFFVFPGIVICSFLNDVYMELITLPLLVALLFLVWYEDGILVNLAQILQD